MSYVVLALKWRPQTFDDVAGQAPISTVLKRALEAQRTGHAYLFTGPRGVGKTSMARILAKALNCEQGPTPTPCNACDACREITRGACMDVLEIDGASNRGIDDIRELKETVRYAPSRYRTKVTIIDEIHMLTPDAFNALLKTLEEPPAHAVFILATTEPLKVPQTIISRCQRFDFGRLTVAQLSEHLQKICRAEGIDMDADAVTLVARRAEGSARDALTLLDQVAASGKGSFDEGAVRELLGLSGRSLAFDLSAALQARDAAGILKQLDQAYQQGLNLQEIMEEMIQHVRNLLIVTSDARLEEMLEATEDERRRYREQAQGFSVEDLLRILRILMDEAGRMRRSPFPRFHLELSLAEAATLPSTEDLARVLQALDREAPPRPASGGSGGAARAAAANRSMGEVDAPAAHGPAAEDENVPDPDAANTGGDLDGRWRDVIARVRVRKIALATCLDRCRVRSFDGEQLLIERSAGDVFLAHQLESISHRRLTQDAVREVFGGGVRCRFVESAAGEPRSEPPERPSIDPVRRIADILDGEIEGPAR
ncbi:MAG: DNA polymerase III subunit gamma/tau [Candidatus Eisenbacteria bacterium]|nr:DNA polymerase III subunit gamma/tau [Candidatus Eisenbacteria bacterium]